MFKLPQNIVLGKGNHDSRLYLAHHSRHLCYKIIYQWQLQTKGGKKKTEGELIHLSYNAIHPIKKPSG